MVGGDVGFELKGQRVWVAGHSGMLGSALVRRLQSEDCEIVSVSRDDLDLRRQSDVEDWFGSMRPTVVLLAAARVGGVLANSRYPASFLTDNLLIQNNVIKTSAETGVRKLVFVSSSCVYPRLASQPIQEEALFTGILEPTNQWYGVAKIAGMMQCAAYRQQHGCDFIAAIPANLYGPGDYFDLENSHVIPAFLRRFHNAVQEGQRDLSVWGTGTARREFVHVDDCADALVYLLKSYSRAENVNIGSGVDISIAELAKLVGDVTGFGGRINFDPSGPEGAPRRLLDSSRLRQLGWQPRIPLLDGLTSTYQWFRNNQSTGLSLRGYDSSNKSRESGV
jgi:GDP-L-fucose synthase